MSQENKEIAKSEALSEAEKTGKKVEVVWREGAAIELYNNKCVDIIGNIDAPSRFIEGKKEEFKESSRYCMVSKTDGTIKLIVNEQSSTDKYTVSGKLEIAKKFKNLGINEPSVKYNHIELANKLKLLRSMFTSNIEHSQICATLRNLKAKINSDIEKLDDRKGNVSDNFRQTVESNMPDTITLKIPVIEGCEAIEIPVDIVLEANGQAILCSLESIDAADIIEEQFKLIIDQEVDKIKDWVTIIEH